MIYRRSPREIECIRKAGSVVVEALTLCREMARSGTATEELDRAVEELVRKRNAIPLFKGYRGYPKSICASINEEVVHGIPGPRKLREGDILSVDVGVRVGGYCADAAITLGIGKISPEAERLLAVCRKALEIAIGVLRPNVALSRVSRAIQEYVESQHCSVVRDYTGHGIGRDMHEEPQIPNFVAPGMKDRILPEGAVLAIEPMVNAGGPKVRRLDNGWTVVTADRSLSAHFEHTVAITANGPDILTRAPGLE